MKKILLIGLVILASCSTPTSNTTNVTNTTGRHVLNSLWQVVPDAVINSFNRSLARYMVNVEASVAAYNAAHIDDQWFIVDGDIPGIDEAPPCSIFIVDRVTHEPLTFDAGDGTRLPYSHTNWPRRQLVENYLGWVNDAESAGGVLYIDVIPPPPTPPEPDQFFASHQIYVINNVGMIKYHWDCSVVPDGFYPLNPDQYYSSMLNTAQGAATEGNGLPDGPWTVVSGYVYTEPTVDPENP